MSADEPAVSADEVKARQKQRALDACAQQHRAPRQPVIRCCRAMKCSIPDTSGLPRSRADTVLSKLLFLARPVLPRGASRLLVLLSARAGAASPCPAHPCHDTKQVSQLLCTSCVRGAGFCAHASGREAVRPLRPGAEAAKGRPRQLRLADPATGAAPRPHPRRSAGCRSEASTPRRRAVARIRATAYFQCVFCTPVAQIPCNQVLPACVVRACRPCAFPVSGISGARVSGMAAKERLAEVVAQHAPALYMHPRDLFMPSTVEWFSAPS